MNEYIHIGPTPTREDSAKIGHLSYDERSRRECRVFRRMLLRLFPVPAQCSATIEVRSAPRKGGIYREVGVRYKADDSIAIRYALQVERAAPPYWDDIARNELLWYERKATFTRLLLRGDVRPNEIPKIFQRLEPPEPEALAGIFHGQAVSQPTTHLTPVSSVAETRTSIK